MRLIYHTLCLITAASHLSRRIWLAIALARLLRPLQRLTIVCGHGTSSQHDSCSAGQLVRPTRIIGKCRSSASTAHVSNRQDMHPADGGILAAPIHPGMSPCPLGLTRILCPPAVSWGSAGSASGPIASSCLSGTCMHLYGLIAMTACKMACKMAEQGPHIRTGQPLHGAMATATCCSTHQIAGQHTMVSSSSCINMFCMCCKSRSATSQLTSIWVCVRSAGSLVLDLQLIQLCLAFVSLSLCHFKVMYCSSCVFFSGRGFVFCIISSKACSSHCQIIPIQLLCLQSAKLDTELKANSIPGLVTQDIITSKRQTLLRRRS